MLLHILQLVAGKDCWRHVAVLDAFVGQQRRSEVPLQIHGLKAGIIEFRDLVIAGEQLPEGRNVQPPQMAQQDPRPGQQRGQVSAGKGIDIFLHFFRR